MIENKMKNLNQKKKYITILIVILAIILVVLIIMIFNKTTIENISEEPIQKEKIIVKEDTFKEQLDSILFNIEELEGSEIEIEGFYMNLYGTDFVSRYGPGCCVDDDYIYMRFIYDEELNIKEVDDWIRVIGTITTKYDEASKVTYIYIDADNIEVLEERGNDTITKKHLLEGEALK